MTWAATILATAPLASVTPAGAARSDVVGAATSTVPVVTPAGADQVVVQFEAEVPATRRSEVLAARGLRPVDDVDRGDFVLARSGGPDEVRAAAAADGVVGIEPVVTVRAFEIPDDPAYPAQWHLPMIQAPRAWDVGDGTGAVVAVLDSGVAYRTGGEHRRAPDLAGVDFVDPYDFVDHDAFPDDLHGHGTHVAGSIAQTTGNGYGGAGLAHGARIMPVRVLDADGLGTNVAIADGIRYAADRGAHIANLSLGSAYPTAVMADAVRYATSRGMTIVAASGNEGAAVAYPAAYPEVIAVGAVRTDRSLAPYSNRGPELDLVAPGGDMASDLDGDGVGDGILQETLDHGPGTFCFCVIAGTSMAAPQVSAAAALLVGNGTTDRETIRQALERSATDLGPPGRDDEFGHGLVQARAALEDFVPGRTPRPIDTVCPTGSEHPGRFTDVPADDLHRRSVECVAHRSIANGVTPSIFAPGAPVRREQMASFLVRLIRAAGHRLDETPVDAFADDDGSVHERAIDQLAAAGVVQGAGGRSFHPDRVVTREALATFLVRTHDLVSGPDLTADTDYFTDDGSSVHESSIDRAAAAGLATGTAPRTYAPGLSLQRNQMASFLARLDELLVRTGHGPPG